MEHCPSTFYWTTHLRLIIFKTRGRKTLPWITKPVLRMLRRRDSAHRKAKRLGTAEAWSAFRVQRNKAVSALRLSRSEYYSSLSEKVSSLKELWSAYRSISGDFRRVPPSISRGSVEAATPLAQRAALLNFYFFASCFTPATTPPVLTAPDSQLAKGAVLADLVCSDSTRQI